MSVHVKFNIIFLLALGVGCASTYSSCRSRIIQPVVPAGERVVLLEEFTGKGCTNCPKGSRELENLLAIYGDQLVVVSIHAGFFANPQFFPLGQYDLRTDEGEALFSFLAPNLGYPAGVINRRKFNGEFQQGANVWAGLVAQEAVIEPQVEFTLFRNYDEDTRRLDVMVDGRAKVAIPYELRVSVMITESGIIDAQDDSEAGGIVEDYVHNHVLREMMTSFDGNVFAPMLDAGQNFHVDFTSLVPAEWDSDFIDIIAFISMHNGNDISVLQAGKIHLRD